MLDLLDSYISSEDTANQQKAADFISTVISTRIRLMRKGAIGPLPSQSNDRDFIIGYTEFQRKLIDNVNTAAKSYVECYRAELGVPHFEFNKPERNIIYDLRVFLVGEIQY